MNVLFVTSEAYPLIKTGGLADVSGSLPRALAYLKLDVRLIMPAYQSVKNQIKKTHVIAQTEHYGYDIQILQTTLPGTRLKILLVDCPELFDRPGNPYLNEAGKEWPDNALRFALFNQVVVDVSLNRLNINWSVDVVHCNDWQSGLTPALLSRFEQHPATIFTIHNLAYQGLYPQQTFIDLGLPEDLWNYNGVEFHDMFSFIKGGLSFADCISTVSPKYAQEIQTKKFGYGLESLLKHRSDCLSGILNGIDTDVWNPGTDEFVEQKYNRRSIKNKLKNKLALQQQFGLEVSPEIPLIGLIGRLVEQKGLELILQSLPKLCKLSIQIVFLGSGQAEYETALQKIAKQYPSFIAVNLGYNEKLAHQIEAGADLFLMPSIFEPCGLNQLYSLRYGTIPIVTPVGGLADSVTDATEQHQSDQTATGFVLKQQTTKELVSTIKRAIEVYHRPDRWNQIQLNAMSKDHSWKNSAENYLQLYQQAITLNQSVTLRE